MMQMFTALFQAITPQHVYPHSDMYILVLPTTSSLSTTNYYIHRNIIIHNHNKKSNNNYIYNNYGSTQDYIT